MLFPKQPKTHKGLTRNQNLGSLGGNTSHCRVMLTLYALQIFLLTTMLTSS